MHVVTSALASAALVSAVTVGCTSLPGHPGRGEGSSAMIFPGQVWVEAAPESQGVDAAKLEAAMQILADICKDRKGSEHKGKSRSLVIRNGRLIWKGSDIDAVQPIHSCTKSMTSSVFGVLVDQGRCTPGTLAADIYPALEEHYPDARLGHFATLTSGYTIARREPWTDLREPSHPPGAAIHYNGQGHMLSFLLQQLAGEQISQVWREHVARRIGIPDETWNWEEVGELEGVTVNGGASGMEINARQIARVGHLYLNKGVWDGERILSENWVEVSTIPQVPPHTRCHLRPDIWYNVLPGRYGYNWWTNGIGADGKRFWKHAPDGTFFAQGNFNNHCIVVPEWDLVLVHLDRGKAIDSKLYDNVFAVLREAIRKQ